MRQGIIATIISMRRDGYRADYIAKKLAVTEREVMSEFQKHVCKQTKRERVR